MHSITLPDIEVVRRRERIDPIDDRKLRRLIADGEWIRITAGAFAHTSDWAGLAPIEQHRLRVAEVARRRRTPVTICFFAAAALADIDILGPWPTRVDILLTAANGGRSSGLVRRRFGDPDTVETIPFGRHRVTSPAQTALDLARTEPFERGVAVIDQAIQTARAGGALSSVSEIAHLLERTGPHRGDTRARRALEFSSHLAANVRESQLRVIVASLGFPTPRVQERRVLRSGRLVFGDLYFTDGDHWLELDGRGKYTSPEFAGDRDPAQIVIDEKNRENEIRREVTGFSRLEPMELDDSRKVYDILTGDGLRSIRPRP